MSNIIFGKLISSADLGGIAIDAPGKGRWIEKLSNQDAELMVKASTKTLVLGRHSRAIMIEFNSIIHYLLVGFKLAETPVDGFIPANITPALFSLAVNDLSLEPLATASEIRDALEGRYMGIADYNGHSLSEIENLFPKILCFRADNYYTFTSDIIRSVGSYASHTYDSGALAVSMATRDSLALLFETANKHVPFSLVLQGMLSFTWQSFFLEVYRCIENMYPYSRLQLLSSRWAPTVPLRDVAIILEDVLSWRPREEEALTSILGRCNNSNIQQLNDAFGGTTVAHGETAASAAKLVYKTRNELVHFRPRAKTSSRSDAAWDNQVRCLIECLSDIYDTTGDLFHEI